MKKLLSGIVLILFLASTLNVTFSVQSVRAAGPVWTVPIYILANGTVSPSTAPIQQNGSIYTLTENITSDTDGIIVQENNITVDGAGYTLIGNTSAYAYGVSLTGVNLVTIKNIRITDFEIAGICLSGSFNNTVSGDNIVSNNEGIELTSSPCDNNVISGNYITENEKGVTFYTPEHGEGPWNNRILENEITSNQESIGWADGMMPRITGSSKASFVTPEELSYFAMIYHNNFLLNAQQAPLGSGFIWDDGYPSGGNYWSNYNGTDLHRGQYQNVTGIDGIGDTPYVIDINNIDHYPLMRPWTPTKFQLTINVIGNGTTTPTPGTYMYDAGTTLNVTAIPDSGWLLQQWILDGQNSGASNPFSLTMNANHTLTAEFKIRGPVIPEYWLGPILGLVGCFAALGLFKLSKRNPSKVVAIAQ